MQYYRPDNMPPVVKNLLILNVLVYIGQVTLKQYDLTPMLGMWPIQSEHFKPYQVITHMFAHSPNSFFHIFFNMFGLWMFGRILENVWGGKRFLIFYLACGLGAAAAHIAVEYFQYQQVLEYIRLLEMAGDYAEAERIRDFPIYVVGASGAVMGIFAAFAYLFPNTELMVLPIPFPIKAKWLVLGLFAIDLYSGIARVQGDNVAHFAHLGGAVTGFIIVLIWNKTNRRTLY